MFSKALFKQSCKANGILWAIITFAVCFMLACVMLITGGGTIGELKTGISDTIITSAVDSEMQGRAINYYEIILNGTKTYNYAYNQAYVGGQSQGLSDPTLSAFATQKANESIDTYISSLLSNLKIEADSMEGQEISALVKAGLNVNNEYDSFYTNSLVAQEVYSYNISKKDENIKYSQQVASIFLASSMTKEENIDNIVNALAKYSVTKESFGKFSYTKTVDGEEVSLSRYTGTDGFNFIKNLSNETIVEYQAKVDYEIENGVDETTAKNNVKSDVSSSFLSTLPKDVSHALEELGSMDLYSLIVGSIFFKMAGLLLPIIYIIMVSNNLIAGQVDSGSMAYVLSTSTKRKQVIFTQALFLVSSLFAMFSLTTITSVICLSIVDNASILLTYSDLILLNLGAFLTLFAMSGISFLASCWFNRSKYSMSVGGGLNMFFLVATMLGLFGSKVLPSVIRLKSLNYFNYVSIISLFDVISIIDGSLTFIWKFAILIVIGIACYVIGGIKFKKKDLPL